MKTRVGIVVTATGLALTPVAVAPVAQADICAGVHGRFVGVSGCGAPVQRITDAAVAGAAIASSDHPYVWGEVPCYTVEGVPYYTPPGDPC